jgi:tetratricopeptide (TPR) repeat protein
MSVERARHEAYFPKKEDVQSWTFTSSFSKNSLSGETARGLAEEGEWEGGDASLLAPMLLRLFTIVVLVLASLQVNAASVRIANEAGSSPSANIADVDQVHTTIRSGFTDLGSAVGAQNQMVETRREYEDSLKTYREFAKTEPETYLPYLAATLNDLGILDCDQNRIEKARQEFEEALKIYQELARKKPDIYLRYVALTLNNLGILENAQNFLEEALKIYRKLAQQERETYLPYMATTLNNLGILYSNKNRVKKARNEYAEALNMYRELAQKEPGTYLPSVPMALNNLGLL